MNSIQAPFFAKLLAALVCFGFAVSPAIAQTTAPTPPQQTTSQPSGVVSCPDPIPPTAGNVALAEGKRAAAEAAFRESMKAEGPSQEKAHDGLIRALIEEDKVKEADAEAKKWLAAVPGSGWAHIASAEVLWRQGKIYEAQTLLQDTSKTAGCNAQLHADFARLLEFMGLYATASKQVALAHRLDPEDPQINSDWLYTQPRAVRLQAVTNTLANDKSLSDEARKRLEERKKALEAPPQPDACRLVSPMGSNTIPFRAMHNGPEDPVIYGLDVGINGTKRRLEIDTGASGIIVYKSAASSLHLNPEIHFKSYGIGDSGNVETYAAKVSSIKIGNLEFADCYVQVIDDSNQRDFTGTKIDSSTDGLIGGDVFSDFLFTLDFPGLVVKLDPLPALPGGPKTQVALDKSDDDSPPQDRYIDPTMATWTKFFRNGHDIILPVVVNNGTYGLFIVDTGAYNNLISPEAARAVGQLSNISDADIIGISGFVKKTYTTSPVDLTFAGMRQHIASMTASDMSRMGGGAGVTISGFLGVPTLHQLTIQIDYRDNLIHFTYDPKRVRRCVAGIKIDDCI